MATFVAKSGGEREAGFLGFARDLLAFAEEGVSTYFDVKDTIEAEEINRSLSDDIETVDVNQDIPANGQGGSSDVSNTPSLTPLSAPNMLIFGGILLTAILLLRK